MTEEITIAGASAKFTATSSNGKSVSAKTVKQLLKMSLNDVVLAALMPKTALSLNLEGSDRDKFLSGLTPGDPDALLEVATKNYPDLWDFEEGRSISTGNTIDAKPWGWMPTTVEWYPDGPGSYDEFGIAPKSLSTKAAENSMSFYMSASMAGGAYTSSMRFSDGVSLSTLSADEDGIVNFDLAYGANPGAFFSNLVDLVLDDDCLGGLECCPHEECEQDGWEIEIKAQKYIPSAAIADAVNRIWTPCEQHRDSAIEFTIDDMGDWVWSPKTKKWSKEE